MSKTNGKKMDKMVLLLIPLAVAINMVAYNVIYPVTMVVIGDSIGTILVGATCGPVAGLLVGLLSNLVNVIKNPVMIVMAPLNMAFGWIHGQKRNVQKNMENTSVDSGVWIYWRLVKRNDYLLCYGWRFLGKYCERCTGNTYV